MLILLNCFPDTDGLNCANTNLENIKNMTINNQQQSTTASHPGHKFTDLIENADNNKVSPDDVSDNNKKSEADLLNNEGSDMVNTLCNGHDNHDENNDPNENGSVVTTDTTKDRNESQNTNEPPLSPMSDSAQMNMNMNNDNVVPTPDGGEEAGKSSAPADETTPGAVTPRSTSGDSRMDQADNTSDKSMTSMTRESE